VLGQLTDLPPDVVTALVSVAGDGGQLAHACSEVAALIAVAT
jgi:hypothetical protein